MPTAKTTLHPAAPCTTNPLDEVDAIRQPHHYRTTTITAALRTSGLVATTLFDGATSGGRFLAYVSDTLVPVLKRGDTVILDNLSVHKVQACARPSRRPARVYSTSRPTARISTRSRKPSKLKALLRNQLRHIFKRNNQLYCRSTGDFYRR